MYVYTYYIIPGSGQAYRNGCSVYYTLYIQYMCLHYKLGSTVAKEILFLHVSMSNGFTDMIIGFTELSVHVIVGRLRRVVYRIYTSGFHFDRATRAEPEWVYQTEATSDIL